jgi:hypothetical protein
MAWCTGFIVALQRSSERINRSEPSEWVGLSFNPAISINFHIEVFILFNIIDSYSIERFLTRMLQPQGQ